MTTMITMTTSKISHQRPLLRVHYHKLVEDSAYSNYTVKKRDKVTFVPPLTVSEYFSYCCRQCGHQQEVKAEELNSIVGSAFRMAYTAQLNKQAARLEDKKENNIGQDQVAIWEKITSTNGRDIRNGTDDERLSIGRQRYHQYQQQRYYQQQQQHQQYERHKFPPNTIPGLDKSTGTFNNRTTVTGLNSNESTPTSDESNSPTELNTYKRQLDKPPLVKWIAFGDKHGDSQRRSEHVQSPPTVRPNPEGCLSAVHKETESKSVTVKDAYTAYDRRRLIDSCAYRRLLSESKLSATNSASTSIKSISDYSSSDSENCSQNTLSSQCCSPLLQNSHTPSPVAISSNSSIASAPPPPTIPPPPPLPPTIPTEIDKINSARQKEENELKSAPWFQAGIPREITLEVLSQESIGAFMVRESTTKPGCFALSVRVPREFHARGIAHYLILKTNKGYKIKGFTKEFSTLTALITHHSVMQELLPCPLSLSRYNPSFTKTDTSKDFADIDSDPDYNTLADFRKMMADLKV